MSLTDRQSHRHCHCHCHCYCYCYCILLLVLVLVTGLVMMVLEVTWMCWRCSLGKSLAGTDNQSQSSLHHITAFPPGLTPAPPLLPWSSPHQTIGSQLGLLAPTGRKSERSVTVLAARWELRLRSRHDIIIIIISPLLH